MKISFNSKWNSIEDLNPYHGFGVAGIHLLTAMRKIGIKVAFNDPTADIGLVFNHPSRAQFYLHQYNILYFPWESTEVHPGWKAAMDGCDEIWAPSPWVADVLRNITPRPVYVFQHGVDHSWARRKRPVEDKVRFFNQGAEAARKNSWSFGVDAFRRAFTDQNDVELTIKYYNPKLFTFPHVGKVTYHNEDWALERLQHEWSAHHVFVYPSSGEGFGLSPLQAIAMGQPTITVGDWAPYIDYLDPDLTLHGTLVPSSWPDIHPGKVYRINFDELVDKYRFAYDNYDSLAVRAYDLAPEVHKNYDWSTLAYEAFSALEARVYS